MVNTNEMLSKLVIQKEFVFTIFFRMLIMNIDCEIMLTNMDNSTDDYNGHLQKSMILQMIQQIFCEMLIGGEKITKSNGFF